MHNLFLNQVLPSVLVSQITLTCQSPLSHTTQPECIISRNQPAGLHLLQLCSVCAFHCNSGTRRRWWLLSFAFKWPVRTHYLQHSQFIYEHCFVGGGCLKKIIQCTEACRKPASCSSRNKKAKRMKNSKAAWMWIRKVVFQLNSFGWMHLMCVCSRELICCGWLYAVAIILQPHSLPHQEPELSVIALVTHLGALCAPCMQHTDNYRSCRAKG